MVLDAQIRARRFEDSSKSAEHIVLATLSSLVRRGEIDSKIYDDAVKDFEVAFEREDVTSI